VAVGVNPSHHPQEKEWAVGKEEQEWAADQTVFSWWRCGLL
jgi:hypothetical protein